MGLAAPGGGGVGAVGGAANVPLDLHLANQLRMPTAKFRDPYGHIRHFMARMEAEVRNGCRLSELEQP